LTGTLTNSTDGVVEIFVDWYDTTGDGPWGGLNISDITVNYSI
jgi:hypothetical protein